SRRYLTLHSLSLYDRLPPQLLLRFFECFGSHRDLHSSPTRRSSDLGDPGRDPPVLAGVRARQPVRGRPVCFPRPPDPHRTSTHRDRKSTRLNSSHLVISYAVFCLKKKNPKRDWHTSQQNSRPESVSR